MFIGHIACALFLRRYFGATVPFWILVVGVSFADYLFVGLGLMGVETFEVLSYRSGMHKLHLTHSPYSHSLAGNCFVSVLLCVWAAVNKIRGSSSWNIFVAAAIAVPSHWFCDFIVHDKDLHFGFHDLPSYGLGLWRYGLAATILEISMVIGGTYLLSGRENSWKWKYCALLVGFQVILEISVRVPAPDNPVAMLLSTLTGYLILLFFAVRWTNWK